MNYDEARQLVQPHLKFAQVPRAGGVITEGMINASTAAALLVGATDNPQLLPYPPGYEHWTESKKDAVERYRRFLREMNARPMNGLYDLPLAQELAMGARRVSVRYQFDDRAQFNDWFWTIDVDADTSYASGHAPTFVEALDASRPYLLILRGEAHNPTRGSSSTEEA